MGRRPVGSPPERVFDPAIMAAVSVVMQPSLFDVEAEAGEPALRSLSTCARIDLGRGAWVEVRPRWVVSADEVFGAVEGGVSWQAERRRMYDRFVDVPRLTAFFGRGATLPHPILRTALTVLSTHHADELGEPFTTVGCCLYRDGRDSVAWHGDTIGRARTEDTMVAIVSLGADRRLALRPRGGGASVGFVLGHGDLLVMGGTCQRTWEHAVPKTARPCGARISLQLRPRGVR